MKQNKETLKQFFETGDKPTQQQYADLIDSYIDSKQEAGEANRRFVIDETGEVSVASEQLIPVYQSGTNVSIDTINPLQPVINVTGNSGATDLSYDAATRTVASSTGTDVILPLADTTNAGLQKANFYEEGTFTPTLVDTGGEGTYAYFAFGNYVRVGNSVTIRIDVPVTSTNGTPTGYLVIGNLPFTGKGTSMKHSLSLLKLSGTPLTDAQLSILNAYVDNTNIKILDINGGLLHAPAITNGDILISGTYITNVYTP